jgi:peptidoglycan hydrolase-like protein with peptidoglycan-binding domain
VETVAAKRVDRARGLSASIPRWAKVLHLTRFIRFLEVSGAALVGLIFIVWPAFADALEKHVALVIGNSAYENAPKLDNAVFDARAVADAFRKLGYQVVDGYNLDISQMRAKVSEFSADLPEAKSAIIYYAGHGISVDEENYLIPTDITLKSPTDLDLGAISVSLVLKQMKREDRVNVVVLDACRDNPFAAALARNKTRAIVGERGLSRIEGDLARGTLIAFASDPKSTALDGPPGEHSPFTAAFLNHVFDQGVSIDTVMSRVRTEVWEKTRHNQLPWVNTSLIGDYALNPEPPPAEATEVSKAAPPPAPPPERQSREDLLWESAQHSNLRADYEAYLDAFPNGFFAQMAKNRIASLTEQGAARSEMEPLKEPDKDWTAEIGTAETEKALDLTPADEKEIQQRLTVLGLYKGFPTGALDEPTRSAITEWQKSRRAALSSYLGPMQLAELRAESENAYQRLLASQSAQKPPAQAVKKPAKSATRAAMKAPAREPPKAAARPPEEPTKAPVRHSVKRVASAPVTTAVAAPAAPRRCNGNPTWCRLAGLSDDSDAAPTGRPPEFMGGYVTGMGAGMLMRRFRHY